MKFFRSINLFPYPINFRYQQSKNYHSPQAIILSLLFFMLINYLIYYFSYDMIHATHPTVLKQQYEIDENQEEYKLTDVQNFLQFSGYLNNTLENYTFDENGEYEGVFKIFNLEIQIIYENVSEGGYFIKKIRMDDRLILNKPEKPGDLIKFSSVDDIWDIEKNVTVLICEEKKDSGVCENDENFTKKLIYDITFPINPYVRIITILNINKENVENIRQKKISIKEFSLNTTYLNKYLDSNDPLFFKEIKKDYRIDIEDINEISIHNNYRYYYQFVKLTDHNGFIFSEKKDRYSFIRNYYFSEIKKYKTSPKSFYLGYLKFENILDHVC